MKTIMVLLLTLIAMRAKAQSKDVDSAAVAKPCYVYIISHCTGLRIYTKDICAMWVDPYAGHTQNIFKREQLSHMPIRDVNDAISLVAGIYQQKRGSALHADGARAEGNLYVVDGMRIMQY